MRQSKAEIVVSVNAKGVARGMEEASLKTTAAASEMDRKVGLASRRMGKNLTGVGNQMGAFGLPMARSTTFIGKKLDETGTKAARFGGIMKQYSGIAALAAAGAAFAIVKSSVQAASSYEDATASIKAAVESAGQSWDKYEARVKQTAFAQASFGFSATEVTGALAKGFIATQSMTKATQFLTLAEDLARAKKIDLAQAEIAVARASEGQLRPLKMMGIDLPIAAAGAAKLATANLKLQMAQNAVMNWLANYPKAIEKGNSANAKYHSLLGKVASAQAKVNTLQVAGDQIIKGLSAHIGGQAAAAAQTYAGKVAQLSAKWENMKTVIGTEVIPVLLKLADAFMAVFKAADSVIHKVASAITSILTYLGLGTAGTATLNMSASQLAYYNAVQQYEYTHGGKRPPKGWKPPAGPGQPGQPGKPGQPSGSGALIEPRSYGGMTGTTTNHITVHVHSADPQSVVNALRVYQQKNGRIPIRIAA